MLHIDSHGPVVGELSAGDCDAAAGAASFRLLRNGTQTNAHLLRRQLVHFVYVPVLGQIARRRPQAGDLARGVFEEVEARGGIERPAELVAAPDKDRASAAASVAVADDGVFDDPVRAAGLVGCAVASLEAKEDAVRAAASLTGAGKIQRATVAVARGPEGLAAIAMPSILARRKA